MGKTRRNNVKDEKRARTAGRKGNKRRKGKKWRKTGQDNYEERARTR